MANNVSFNKVLNFKNDKEKLKFDVEALHIRLINRVIETMEAHNISRKELAQAMNVSEKYLTQLFSAEKLLTLRVMAKIERIIGKII